MQNSYLAKALQLTMLSGPFHMNVQLLFFGGFYCLNGLRELNSLGLQIKHCFYLILNGWNLRMFMRLKFNFHYKFKLLLWSIIIFNHFGYSDVFSTKYKFKIVRIILSIICYTFTLFFRENSRSPSKEKSKSRSRSIEKNGDRSPEIKEDN